ncbi:MAG: cytochrome C oxidase subunit III [Gemmatimonadales bacterium]
MKPLRPTADAAALPSVTFGQRSVMWWGTLGFMTIEGWTVALLLAAYLYLRQNYDAWPPLRTPNPRLVIPTINLALMLLSFIPAWTVARAAARLDTAAVKRWLLITCVIELPILVLRWWELWALNTRWDTTAYGSAAWTIVGFHTSLLLLDVLDTLGLTLFYFMRRQPVKTFSDTSDNSFYWYFTVGIWIPIYLIVYVGPRVA